MMITRDSDLEARHKPQTGEYWQHANGPYRVIGIANDYAEPKGAYPVTVVYENREGKLHTGPLSDWHRRMTLIGFQPPEGTRWKPPMIRLHRGEDD